MLDALMKQLEKELGMSFPGPVPGKYRMPVNESTWVEISAIPKGIILTYTFSETPKRLEEPFFEQLLLANLFGNHTTDAVIGLNEEQHLTLTRSIEEFVDYREFRDMLEDFLNVADFWDNEAVNYAKQT